MFRCHGNALTYQASNPRILLKINCPLDEIIFELECWIGGWGGDVGLGDFLSKIAPFSYFFFIYRITNHIKPSWSKYNKFPLVFDGVIWFEFCPQHNPQPTKPRGGEGGLRHSPFNASSGPTNLFYNPRVSGNSNRGKRSSQIYSYTPPIEWLPI